MRYKPSKNSARDSLNTPLVEIEDGELDFVCCSALISSTNSSINNANISQGKNKSGKTYKTEKIHFINLNKSENKISGIANWRCEVMMNTNLTAI